ncbi:MAG TPA: lipoyl(octanoyl) transferase LipB [Chitinophagaceae bacterium]|nr:lipoyl(octanoyl) transferase LipB [Chitinophagaceae bacterium]
MKRELIQFRDLGLMDYQAAWDYQEQLLHNNVEAKAMLWKEDARDVKQTTLVTIPETIHHLLFVEHPPVYTLGKSGKKENVLLSEEGLIEKDIQFYTTNRGGDITFHGPGQVVGYPILDLEKFYTDIGKYLRNLEEVIIRTIAEYGIRGDRSAGETGVWIEPGVPGRERKICAIGVRCSRWITMHGFAFNVNTDLSYFNHIIPCGIVDKQVTSLEKELGQPMDITEVKERIKKNFERVFEAKLV